MADFISSIGANANRLNPANQVAAPQRAVTQTPKTDAGNNVSAQVPAEGFSPTSEARESLNDTKAGEAKASEILGAWGAAGQASPVASTGNLAVSGASNTAVNQVHGVGGGVYQASNGSKPGFTEATVYSSKPPTA